MEDKTLNSWNDFTGSTFLKADDVKDLEKPFVCVGVQIEEENYRPRLTLEHAENRYQLDLNITNCNNLKELGIETPNHVVGKKIWFNKVMARNPVLKKEVESLRIKKVE